MWPINFRSYTTLAPTTKANNQTVTTVGWARGNASDMLLRWFPVNIDISLTLLRVQRSDDSTNGSDGTWSTVGNSTFGTSLITGGAIGAVSVLPTASDAGKFWTVYIPKARYLYYRWNFTVGAGSTGTQYVADAIGFGLFQGPSTDVDRGGVTGSFLVSVND